MEVNLRLDEGASWVAEGSEGHELIIDGSPELGGIGRGPRPMELLLIGLGGCAGMDLIHILKRGRQGISGARLSVRGQRAAQPPKVFEEIHIKATLWGEKLSERAAQRALSLSLEKYCSAAKMLGAVAEISGELELLKAPPTREG